MPTKKKPVKKQEAKKSIKATNEVDDLDDDIEGIDGKLNDKIRQLIHHSKEQGYLTVQDINDALPESISNPEEIENVITILENLEIDILDSQEVEHYKERMAQSEEKELKGSHGDILDDPVRMYLKQMGQVPLLTREEEVEISMRIEDSETNAQNGIFSLEFLLWYTLDLANKLQTREEKFDKIVIDKRIDSRESYFNALEKNLEEAQKLKAKYEYMIDLCNDLGADLWLTIPHQASDEYFANLGELVAGRLDPDLKVYVEYSNEVWNGGFDQAKWVEANVAGQNYSEKYANKSSEVWSLFDKGLGSEARSRVIHVGARQIVNTYELERYLKYVESKKADPNFIKPDVIAGAIYFGFDITPEFEKELAEADTEKKRNPLKDKAFKLINAGLDKQGIMADKGALEGVADWLGEHKLSYAEKVLRKSKKYLAKEKVDNGEWAKFIEMGRKYGYPVIAYEGGQGKFFSHKQSKNKELVDFAIEISRDPRMGLATKKALETWNRLGGQLPMIYMDVYIPSKHGSWGLKEYYDQPLERAHKYREVVKWIEGKNTGNSGGVLGE